MGRPGNEANGTVDQTVHITVISQNTPMSYELSDAHALWYSFGCENLMTNRLGLGSTTLHYLAIRQAMVSVHRPVHWKITLTYSLTLANWLLYTLENGFQGVIKRQGGPFLPRLCSSLLCSYCSEENCRNMFLLKHSYANCPSSINMQFMCMHGHIDGLPTLN